MQEIFYLISLERSHVSKSERKWKETELNFFNQNIFLPLLSLPNKKKLFPLFSFSTLKQKKISFFSSSFITFFSLQTPKLRFRAIFYIFPQISWCSGFQQHGKCVSISHYGNGFGNWKFECGFFCSSH